jgi:hypothetical protein
VLRSGAINQTKEFPMLTAIDRLASFSPVTLTTNDPKVKARANKCSACGALVGPMDTTQHRRFHDELRKIAKQADPAR